MIEVYGIDFSPAGSIAVRLTGSARRPRWEKAEALPSGARALIACSLPAYDCFTRRLAAPLASIEKARKVLPSLLDVQLPFPLEKGICQFPEIESRGGETDALAVAVRIEDINAALGRMREKGLDPAHVDHEALALWSQLQEEIPPAGDEVRAILYVGRDRTAVVAGRGRRFIASQGSRFPTPDLQRINQFLRAQLRDDATQPFTWAVVGPGAGDSARAALARPEGTTFLKVAEPAAFLARALAARAVSSRALPCNFRSGEMEHPARASGRVRAVRASAFACLAASLLLIALNIGWRIYLQRRDDGIQRQLTALAAELTGMAKVPKGQEVVVARRAVEERSERLAPFARLLKSQMSERVAVLLDAANRNDLQLGRLAWTDAGLTVSGMAPTGESVAPFVQALAGMGWSAEVERGEAGSDGRVPFTVKGHP